MVDLLVAQGVLSVMQGGSFEQAFWSGALGSLGAHAFGAVGPEEVRRELAKKNPIMNDGPIQFIGGLGDPLGIWGAYESEKEKPTGRPHPTKKIKS